MAKLVFLLKSIGSSQESLDPEIPVITQSQGLSSVVDRLAWLLDVFVAQSDVIQAASFLEGQYWMCST